MYGKLNNLYTEGDIMKVWTNNENIKQLLIKLLFIKIEQNMKIIAIKVDVYLKNNLLFGFTIGLLWVSAGEFLYINNVKIRPSITLILFVKYIYLQTNGKHINIKVEDNKQIQLLVACNPNDVVLITLYINKNIITSFKILSMYANKNITTILDIVRYNPSNPYLIMASLSSS